MEDLLQRDADIAVRMVAPRQEVLVVKRIGAIPLGLHATPAYLARRGTPRTVAELAGHDLVGPDRETPDIRALRRQMPEVEQLNASFTVGTCDQVAQLALVRAGCGIGLVQCGLAARAPRLVRALPEVEFPLETWLAMHENLRMTPCCRVVFDGLAEGLRGYCAAP